MSSRSSQSETRRIRQSNATVGWLLLAAVVAFVLFCGIFARQTRQFFGLSSMAASHGGHAGSLGAPLNAYTGMGPDVYGDARYGSIVGEPALYSPEQGLSESQSTCSLPYPMGDCGMKAAASGQLYGMSLGDANLYPSSYMPPAFFNTSGYALGCGDCPNGCGKGCQCRM